VAAIDFAGRSTGELVGRLQPSRLRVQAARIAVISRVE
jgi:hypothetical protein